jgi:hypothetical protein
MSASDIVPLFVNTKSLIRLPGSKPASDVFTGPDAAGATAERAAGAALAETDAAADTDAVAAVAGTTAPMTRAETARKQVRSREILSVFRERGARRDM